jgi:hypothetical protein
MSEFLFWFSLIFILYPCAGYPALLFVWSRLFPKPVRKAYLKPEPLVSVVIAARNEEKNIRPRIENEARGVIIVFADSRQIFDRSAVSALVSNFSDTTVGGRERRTLPYGWRTRRSPG